MKYILGNHWGIDQETTITKYIESLGIPVYIADDGLKKLLDTPEVIKELTDTFSENILENNLVDKKKLIYFCIWEI